MCQWQGWSNQVTLNTHRRSLVHSIFVERSIVTERMGYGGALSPLALPAAREHGQSICRVIDFR